MRWWEDGAQVEDELAAADHRFRDRLIEVHREDERVNGPEAPPSRWTRADG